jgi:hypothetical protein
MLREMEALFGEEMWDHVGKIMKLFLVFTDTGEK